MQRLALCWTSVVITLFTFRIDLAHAASGNTTCASTQLDWYTDAVGETPCVTYQRLRQICNSDYQVPTFRPNTPGDNCDDQLMECCCNSISWGLSMLCMNCQYDPATGTTGIDAGVGAYEMYSTRGDGSMCTPGTNKTLPADIQSAVCNRGIKISDFLYDLFWSDGTWFYIYTKETAQTDQAANNNNTFSHCPNTTSTISATSSTQTSSASPSPSVTASSPSTISPPPQFSSNLGAIVGGAVGGGLGLIAVFLLGAFLLHRRRRGVVKSIDLGQEYVGAPSEECDGYDHDMSVITPFSNSESGSSTDLFSKEAQGEYGPIPSKTPISPSQTFGSYDFDKSLRHEDAGPIPQLSRSISGRLPPAYESWESPHHRQSRPIDAKTRASNS